MRVRLSTVGLVAVVGGVVVAAAVDSLTGHSAGAHSTLPATTATPSPAAPRRAGATILFGGQVENGAVTPGLLLAARAEPRMQRVEVGIRPDRPGSAPIRVRAERLRLGPGVGTPSGERIAFWAWNPSRPALDGIYSRAAAGSALGRITAAPRGRLQQPLAYSPDGAGLLVFQANRDRRSGSLSVVRADGTDRIRLTPPGMTSWCCSLGAPAAWGPNGRIAFAAFAPGAAGRDGKGAVYVVRADGSGVRGITPATAWATAARWSPDGRWIAFDQADRPGGAHDLFLVHPDGTGLHRVLAAAGADGSCCAEWSPDSRSLVYAAGPPNGRAELRTVHLDRAGALTR